MPEHIWIEPKCCSDYSTGQTWCDHDAWSCENGEKADKYTLTSTIQPKLDAADELAKALEEIIVLDVVKENITNCNIEMAEQALEAYKSSTARRRI